MVFQFVSWKITVDYLSKHKGCESWQAASSFWTLWILYWRRKWTLPFHLSLSRDLSSTSLQRSVPRYIWLFWKETSNMKNSKQKSIMHHWRHSIPFMHHKFFMSVYLTNCLWSCSPFSPRHFFGATPLGILDFSAWWHQLERQGHYLTVVPIHSSWYLSSSSTSTNKHHDHGRRRRIPPAPRRWRWRRWCRPRKEEKGTLGAKPHLRARIA